MQIRRVLAACALVVLVVAHAEYTILPLTFFRWRPFQRTLNNRPNGTWPEYPLFLQGVRDHTSSGASVGVVVPGMNREETYSYAYYRASYFLTGREVLPLYYRSTPRPENLARADFLAVWQAAGPPARVVWRGHGGVLLSRR